MFSQELIITDLWSAIYYVTYVCDVCEPLHVCSQSHMSHTSKCSSSKKRKIRDRVDSRVQYRWKLRVIGFCPIIFHLVVVLCSEVIRVHGSCSGPERLALAAHFLWSELSCNSVSDWD